MKQLLMILLVILLLAGCQGREKLKEEIKEELADELKAELVETVIQELDKTGRLLNPDELISEESFKKSREKKEDWEIDYKTFTHKKFENLNYALPSDPGHYVTISLSFTYQRKYRRVFAEILSNKEKIFVGIEKILSSMTYDDFSDAQIRDEQFPARIRDMVNETMRKGEIDKVEITSLILK